MLVDDELIDYLEELSSLLLSKDEKQRLSADLSNILDLFAKIDELDTENVTGRSHPFDNVNALREDEVQASFERELILENAPENDGEMIIAPMAVS
ncbi:MAG: Asp-tRNA(Asn)/Glu-tRNA(Gln) amidotransferase subunit GatC [Oscillospiraceae bacterium]|nr:Asp-tRNA(Asn)/Glu-tRNA(Gln) amidotransferase subunit GatC [Oscillospiraceae bacterium]